MADPLTTTYSLVFFTERNLREQATRIEKNKTVMATEYSQTQNDNNPI